MSTLSAPTCECGTCGHTWPHGQNGNHSCAAVLKEKLRLMTAEARAWEITARAQDTPAPCGHPAQYCYTPDGKGIVIRCYVCDLKLMNDRCTEQAADHIHATMRTTADNQRLRAENTDLHRQIARMESTHGLALRQEEEKGYARGLDDGRKLLAEVAQASTPESEPQASRLDFPPNTTQPFVFIDIASQPFLVCNDWVHYWHRGGTGRWVTLRAVTGPFEIESMAALRIPDHQAALYGPPCANASPSTGSMP